MASNNLTSSVYDFNKKLPKGTVGVKKACRILGICPSTWYTIRVMSIDDIPQFHAAHISTLLSISDEEFCTVTQTKGTTSPSDYLTGADLLLFKNFVFGDEWGSVKSICKILGISRSNWHKFTSSQKKDPIPEKYRNHVKTLLALHLPRLIEVLKAQHGIETIISLKNQSKR